MRAKFQVLVLPFRKNKKNIEYCIFKREDMKVWQGVAGGGEGKETPLEAALREFNEETGIKKSKIVRLDSISTIPIYHFKDSVNWEGDIYVVKEYAFATEIKNDKIKLSSEHLEYKWVSFEEANKLLKWDSNRNALWEIKERINRGKL